MSTLKKVTVEFDKNKKSASKQKNLTDNPLNN